MEHQAEEVLQSALKSYGDVFVAVGQAGAQAFPPVGDELKESLLNLKQRLNGEASASVIAETEHDRSVDLATRSARMPEPHGQAVVYAALGDHANLDSAHTSDPTPSPRYNQHSR